MDRNNGRYPYIRRQGSGNGPHNHHHHNNANSSTTSSSSSPSSASTTNTTHNTQYSNNSINNAATNTNALYAAVSQQQQQQQLQQSPNVPISQHDELIRYIREAWNKVRDQGTPVIKCTESDNQLKNFKPFNLEEYWGQRLVQNIHVTTTHQ